MRMKGSKQFVLLSAVLLLSACTQVQSPVETTPTPTPVSETPATPSKTFEITSVDDEFNLYRDFENHYSFKFPKQITLSQCEAAEEKVNMTVIRDGNIAYLTPEKTQRYTDIKVCSVITASAKSLAEGAAVHNGPLFVFKTVPVKDDTEITSFLKKEYGPGCSMIDKKLIPGSTDAYAINIKTAGPEVPENEMCFINYITETRYSPTLGEIVKWDIGQDINFFNNDKPSYGRPDASGTGRIYDFVISDSFSFEK